MGNLGNLTSDDDEEEWGPDHSGTAYEELCDKHGPNKSLKSVNSLFFSGCWQIGPFLEGLG